MTNPVARRSILLGLGQAATLGGLVAALPRAAKSAQAAAAASPKVCLSMLYPSGEGLTFDADAFRDRHVALLKKVYGPAMDRVELRVALPPPPLPPVAEGETPPQAPPPPPLLAAASMWLGDLGEFIKRAQASSRDIAVDMATITKSAPMVQFDVLEGEAGEAARTVIGGSIVVSDYFFAKEGATWDAAYFGKTYVPKLVEAYGPAAVQRAEGWRGELAQGGGKPLAAGSVQLYLKDAAAYDAAVASEAVIAVGTDAQKYTTINPVRIVMSVHTTA